MIDFEAICERYALGELQVAAPLKPGTVAQVWKLETIKGSFVLRTLTGKDQGKKEQTIHQHLMKKHFARCPAAILTGESEPFLDLGGTWYQVQGFLSGGMPDPAAPGVAGAIARTVGEMTAALSDCPFVDGTDRFDLAAAWKEGRKFWPSLETDYTLQQAEHEVFRCCVIPEQDIQVIHGDLGPWNMIDNGHGAIFVIDFGEARMGDPYFDLASALGGIINHTPADLRQPVCQEFLDELAPDRQRLLDQLRLWVWRGLAQWAILAGKGISGARMAARFCNALKWAEENIYDL